MTGRLPGQSRRLDLKCDGWKAITSVRAFSSSTGRRVLLLLLGACCLSAGEARAQVGRVPVLDRTVPRDEGFKLNFGVGGGYTTNPTFLTAGGVSSRDMNADLRAGIANRKTSPRTEWSARYDAYYTHYGNNSQFDTINHALNFDGRYLTTPRSSLSLAERFFYSRNPLQIGASGPADDAVILTRETKRLRSVSDATFDTSLSRSLALQAGASFRVERLDMANFSDNNTYSARFGMVARMGEKDSLSSILNHTHFNYVGAGTVDSTAHGVDVSWSHQPPEGTGWELSAGVSQFTQDRTSQRLFIGEGSLHHRFRPFDFTVDYRRRLDADAAFATVSVAQDAHAGFSRPVGRFGSLGVFGEYGTRSSPAEIGVRPPITYTGGGIHGSFAFDPRVSLSFDARRRQQTADPAAGGDLTYDSILVGLAFQVI